MAYGDDPGFTAWLTSQGYSLPVGAPAVAVLRQRGSDYVDGLGADPITGFFGVATDPLNQTGAWPRTGAMVGQTAIPSDTVPPAIIRASYMAAYQEGTKQGSLTASGSLTGQVKRVRVEGAVEKEFQALSSSADVAAAMTPMFTSIAGMIKPYLRPNVPLVGLLSIGGPICG